MAVRPLTNLSRDGATERDLESRRAAILLVLACGLLGAGLAVAADAPVSRMVGLAVFVSVIAILVRAYLHEHHAHLRFRGAYDAAVEERRKFISTVSHDFRSPLTAVVGFTQLLCEENGGLDPSRRRDYLRVIREQSQHLSRMIEDTVDLSRLAEGRLGLSPTVRPVQGIVEGALSLLDHSSDRDRITVTIAPEAPPVCADQYELEQILDRLLHFALKQSSKDTDVTLHIASAPDGRVRFALRADGLTSAAEGLRPLSGDSASAISLGTHDPRYLAMATTRALIELHGGSIAVEDGTVVFTLPAFHAEPQLAPYADLQ